MSNQDGLEIKKLDYLQGKYVFRYPYTFTSIKWGLVLGGFFGLHTYIKGRNMRLSFFSWVQKTVLFTFIVWGYFYAKYNFYQNSINQYEEQEDSKSRQAMFLKKYLEYKLKIPIGVSLNQDQLLQRYEDYKKQKMIKSSNLDMMLFSITQTTFDLPNSHEK